MLDNQRMIPSVLNTLLKTAINVCAVMFELRRFAVDDFSG